MIIVLKSVLGVFAAIYAAFFTTDYLKNRDKLSKAPWPALAGTGFLTNFLDTLGIGSFAQQTAIFKFFKLVDDRIIPGTLNVANTIPTMAEAFIFMTVVAVAPLTLACMAIALAMLAGLLNWFPSGGEAIGLTGWKLILATAVSFCLGALHTIGVGFFAPCMALVYALGMSPRVAFPIMMTSTAMLISAASIRFIAVKAHDRKASLFITIFGVIGVLIAAYIVRSLPLTILKWLVLAVIVYTAAVMLASSRHKDGAAAAH